MQCLPSATFYKPVSSVTELIPVGAAALLMLPFMFMFVPTEWPLAQTT